MTPRARSPCRTYVLSETVPSLPRVMTRTRTKRTASPSGSSARSTWRSTSPPSASTASSRLPAERGPRTGSCRERSGRRPDGRRSRRPAAAGAPRPRASRSRRAPAAAPSHAGRRLGARRGARNDEEPPGGGSRERNGGDLLSQGRESQVPSALRGLTALFGMGRGVSPSLWPPKLVETARLRGAAGPRRGLKTAPRPKVSGDSKNPSRPRPISTGLLSVSPRLHSRPINLVVYQGSYSLKGMGELISRSASRLDAFSGYPIRT